ncbi:MAG: heptaprenyl diphosphate synthase [Tenericutes bacterium HGW-Tenericutes-6]|jgi:heptaprenyl diphosphate synthase|nr:MAG: heptaprenyl diphosphate synthase [Tenericutes bacterium HGW-Tenericutes-6]
MKKTKKMVLLANFLAIAIVLNIIESAIPVIPVPGAKLGFANIMTLVILYMYSFKDSAAITILRVLLVSILTAKLLNPVFFMSMSGAVFAMLAMGFFKKTNFFGILGVSVLGSVFHCLGQVTAGIFVIGSTAVLLYLPVMLFLSIPAGALTGVIAQRFLSIWQTYHREIA